MPALMTFYEGVKPWHFGGPEEFTAGEARVLVEAMDRARRKQAKAEREAANAARQRGR